MRPIEIGIDEQTGFCAGSADELDHFLVTDRGSAGQFLLISENMRCSMGFHLEAPLGEGATVTSREKAFDNWVWIWVFQAHRFELLLPPESARTSSREAFG